MAQHDYNLANQSGADFRADLNNALSAIATNNSGSSQPSTTFAYEWWVDTSSDVLKIRNSADNAWITLPISVTTDNTVDINGGTVNGITSLSFSSGSTVTTILDEDNLASDSATALATQQSIKAYVDSQVTAQDLDITDGSSSISIDLDSESLGLLGGTGITSTASGNNVTFAIDTTVATLTGSQTLTNKTFDADNNTVTNLEVDNLKSGVLDTDLSSVSGSDDTLASAKAIKNYVDTQITAEDLDISDGSTAISIDLDSETLSLLGGTGVSSTASGNGVTFAIGQAVGTGDNVQFNQVTSALVGNASTATSLQTARTINGTSFDGTANITFDSDAVSEGSANLYFTNERVDDRVNDLLVAGSGITLTYNDGSNTLTIAGQVGDITSVVAGDGLTGGGTSGDVTLAVGVDDSSIEINSDALRVKASGITNAMLSGSIANAKLSNSSVTINSQSLSLGATLTLDTDNIGEGSSNLYYTDARSNSAIDARVTQSFVNALNVNAASVDNNSVALGTKTTGNYVATVAGTTNEIEVSGSGSETASVTIGLPDDVTIAGNLTVNGTTTTVNSDTLSVTDPLIKLAKSNSGADSLDIGFYGLYDTSGSQDLYAGLFRDANDSGKFKLFKDLQVEPTTTVNTSGTGYAVGTLVSNLEGNVTGNVTGSADTLTTARAIALSGDVVGTANFDGSAGISISTTIQANSVALGTDTTGNFVADLTAGEGIDVSGGGSENATITVSAEDATETNKGIASFDGTDFTVSSGDVTVNVERIQDIVGGMVTGNTETGITVTYQDADGTLDFVVGTLNQDTTGNAATATALETARTIGGVSFDGTGNIDLAGVNTAGNQNTSGNAATATALANARTIGGTSFDGTANIAIALAATSTALATARNIGGVSFDGTADITPKNLADADGDTKVQVEESSDEDKIRFDTGGTERVVIDSDGITVSSGLINGVGIKYNITDFSNSLLISNDAGTGTLDAASHNTGLGDQVFDDLTSGTSNTAMGSGALDANTTGGSNTAIGRDSLGSNTTASNNVAIGKSALTTNTTGEGNTSVGKDSLKDNTTGGNNTAVGENALANNTTASENTAVGQNALLTSTTAGNNVAIGHDAMRLTTTGGNNVAVGLDALRANTTGDTNTAVGKEALTSNTTGTNNTALGARTLDANTTGTNLVAVGDMALGANTTANNNVAVGVSALEANTTGSENVAVGRFSLKACTTGANNTAIGDAVLFALTTSQSCVGVGNNALQANTSGSQNIAMGVNALIANTTGENHVCIGHSSGSSLTTGNRNTALGAFTLDACTTGDDNTCIGKSAGGAITTGSDNTLLGESAGDAITTGSNNVVLGKESDISAADGINQLVLGLGITGDSNGTFTFGTSAGKVHNHFGSDASFTRDSDLRLKKNITDTSLGLSFINDLRTVKYNWKGHHELDSTDSELAHLYKENEADNTMITDVTMHGFIAQEVKAALDTAGVSDWAGWEKDKFGVQRISREMFVIPLVKAVQELSAKVDELQQQLDSKGE